MNPPLATSKSILRGQIYARLKTISPEQRATASAQICARLKESEVWHTAKSVLFFAPLPDELDIWPLLADALAAGKLAALPCFDSENKGYLARRIIELSADVRSGHFGIREPSPACPVTPMNRLDLTLVPGVAFDPSGRRLGRGKGFYDRLLPLAGGVKCGVAFDEQIVDAVPAEPHDVTLNRILTPTRWL